VITNSATNTGGNGNVQAVDVSCPAGKVALGGGGQLVTSATALGSQRVVLTESYPNGSPANGWHVEWQQTSGTGTVDWNVTAYVVCTV
jgi:hypothetical protein